MSDEPLVASSTVEEQAPPPEKLTGISVYPGIAYGLCQQFSAGDLEIPQFVIEKTGTRGEIQRLRAAIATVRPRRRRSSTCTAPSFETPP